MVLRTFGVRAADPPKTPSADEPAPRRPSPRATGALDLARPEGDEVGTDAAETAPSGAPDGPPADQPTPPSTPRRRFYLPVAVKFAIAVTCTVGWVAASMWISRPWIDELDAVVGSFLAWTVVVLVAYLPGAIVAFLASSLLLDRQPSLPTRPSTADVTVIIAARNEEGAMTRTLESIARSDHLGVVSVILADNGSTDGTVAEAQEAAERLGLAFSVVHEPTPGKANALNTALRTVTTDLVVTVDADTLLHREALRRLITRLEVAPDDTDAVAGTVLVRNSRTNLLTRMQEWDYYLGIAAVKRMQGLYQATLVAQGAFSLYRTEALRAVGGWPDAIGEDIVLTWRLMEGGRRVYFEPTAVAFTDVPEKVPHFMRQRARWARGMLEGIRSVPPWRQRRPLTKAVAGVDLLIPFLDIGYVFVWLPGLVLFLLGTPLIVSAWTLAVLPITLLVYGGVRAYQARHVFGPLGLHVRRNRAGYLAFLLAYQVLCSTASLAGYAQHLVGARRRWK